MIMNNNILLRFLFVWLFLAGTACTNLDENLYDTISANETVLTSDDLGTIIAPAYAKFRNIYWDWNGLFDIYEECADLTVTPFRVGIGWGDLYIDMHKHTWGPSIDHGEGLWARTYQGINLCNQAIYQIQGLNNVQNRDAVLAEVKALRAIYYYILYDNFRNIPIVTRFDVEPGFLPEQSDKTAVFNFIESELKAAMPLLLEDKAATTYGRVTKWAAKMTLAKLYLNAKIYLGTEMWDEALAEVNDIINSGKFSLLSTYSANFALGNAKNSEEIFSIVFDGKYTGSSYYPQKTLHPISSATYQMPEPWGGSCGIPQFIDTYDEDDSRLKECWQGGLQVDASGSPLMDGNKQFEYINYVTSVDAAEYNEGYRLVKYEIPKGQPWYPDNDVPFYRYADALMIKAECLLRKGQPEDAAVLVTQVRQRAFKGNPSKATVTGAQLQQGSTYPYGAYAAGVITELQGGSDIIYGRLLDELAWEFVGEHRRRQDLIRFGVFTTKKWLTHVPSPKGDNIIIFPIPQSQRETNVKLQQNPGY